MTLQEIFSEVIHESGASSAALAKGDSGIVIDFSKAYLLDPETCLQLLENPRKFIDEAHHAAQESMRPHSSNVKGVYARIRNLPEDTPLRRIGAHHVGKLLQVSGVVRSVSVVQPVITSAAFRCRSCNNEQETIVQDTQFLKGPQGRCPDCGESAGYDFYPSSSIYMDQQWVTVQEPFDQLPPGQIPRDIRVEARGGLCREANPGDRVKIVCIMDVLQDSPGDRDLTLTMVGRAVDISSSNQEAQLTDFTPEEVESFKRIASDPEVVERLVDSFTPTIYGLRSEKKSILCSLFGGVGKDVAGTKIRGDTHVLLVGDPGCGKSQLLLNGSKVSPRGVLTTGRGSSGVGLTASVSRDQKQGFFLEAGAMVLGDRGNVFCDELDKMRDEDREAIHPAMEQQVIPISKGGINTVLNARCGFIAAANPKVGRWNPYQTIIGNLDLPVTILNRFDLIWVLRDTPDPFKDSALADHVLNVHQGNGVLPPIDSATLRRYIAYSRQFNPKVNQNVSELIKGFYLKLRGASNENDATILITARQLESIIRVSESFARMRLHDEVSTRDAEDAVNLIDESMGKIGLDPDSGKRDMDVLAVGRSMNLQERINLVLNVMGDVKRESIDGVVFQDELARRLVASYKWSDVDIEKILGVMKNDGLVFCPRLGVVAVTQ